MTIKNMDQLRSVYGEASGRAKIKTLPELDVHAKAFIERSPFMVLATYGKDGSVDASPRGGAPGFVHIANPQQLIFPDAKGNNRVDSLSNMVETGRIGMLFLIPGMDETLRELVTLRSKGVYPMHPDDSTCRYCPYDAACRRTHPPTLERETASEDADRFRRTKRKQQKRPLL